MASRSSIEYRRTNLSDLKQLQKVINVKFDDLRLLKQAVTHKSFINEQPDPDLLSYERLEFLGDSILGQIIAEQLYVKFPNLSEGELTKMRSALVSGESLFQIGQKMGIDQFIITGKGERLSNGSRKRSVVAAIFESITAAIYLDRGLDPTKTFILDSFKSKIDEMSLKGLHGNDPKSDLQEFTQKTYQELPKYKIISQSGPDHEPTFEISVAVQSVTIAIAKGSSKSEAESKVAYIALQKLILENL